MGACVGKTTMTLTYFNDVNCPTASGTVKVVRKDECIELPMNDGGYFKITVDDPANPPPSELDEFANAVATGIGAIIGIVVGNIVLIIVLIIIICCCCCKKQQKVQVVHVQAGQQ